MISDALCAHTKVGMVLGRVCPGLANGSGAKYCLFHDSLFSAVVWERKDCSFPKGHGSVFCEKGNDLTLRKKSRRVEGQSAHSRWAQTSTACWTYLSVVDVTLMILFKQKFSSSRVRQQNRHRQDEEPAQGRRAQGRNEERACRGLSEEGHKLSLGPGLILLQKGRFTKGKAKLDKCQRTELSSELLQNEMLGNRRARKWIPRSSLKRGAFVRSWCYQMPGCELRDEIRRPLWKPQTFENPIHSRRCWKIKVLQMCTIPTCHGILSKQYTDASSHDWHLTYINWFDLNELTES